MTTFYLSKKDFVYSEIRYLKIDRYGEFQWMKNDDDATRMSLVEVALARKVAEIEMRKYHNSSYVQFYIHLELNK